MNTRTNSPQQFQSGKPHKAKDKKQQHKTVAAENGGSAKRQASPAVAAPAATKAAKPAAPAAQTKHALESVVESFEQSFKAAGLGAAAWNRKLIAIAQENVNSGLELVRDLAGARTPLQVMRLQMSYWHDMLGAFESQAKELRALSADAMAKTAEPVREHIRRA
jgi:hypothetical protein